MGCLKGFRCVAIPQRFILSFMGFIAVAVSFTMRACLAITITAMVAPANSLNMTKNRDHIALCSVDATEEGSNFHSISDTGTRYHWTQEQQGWILSSFYVGYLLAHIPAGGLAEKFGGKWIISLSVLITSICNALTPLAVSYGGFKLLIVMRIVLGAFGGVIFPALAVLLAAWVPEKERSKLGSLAFSGSQVGSLLSFYVSGLILSYQPWPTVFYFWSIISVIWFIFFTLLCSNDPASHPFISEDELDYLNCEMGQLKRQRNLPTTPWKEIFTSVPVIALLIAQVGNDSLWTILAVYLPKYMKEVLGFSIHKAGLYSSLPYLLLWIVSILSGFLCDYLINHRFLTTVQARKLFGALSGIFPASFLVAASYAGCDRPLVVILFILAMGFLGNYFPSLRVNALDLSPNYSASIISIVNGAGSLTAIIVPAVIGSITPNSTIEEWRIIFWFAFAIALVRTVVYSIWASADIQPWNNYKINSPQCRFFLKTHEMSNNNQKSAYVR